MMNHERLFFDERINRVCGRTYRTGILLAVLYTVLYGICRTLTVGFHVLLYLNEFFIVLTGCIILLVGLVRGGWARDERAEFEKHTYYLTAGKVFVVMALLGYAVSIPLRMRLTNDYAVNDLIRHLLILGCVYFFYTFKRHQISFNYSFIEEPSSAYYVRVLLNMAKMAGILLIPFGLAAFLDLALHRSFLHFLAILWGYVASVLGLGVDYFLLSALEKCNVGSSAAGMSAENPAAERTSAVPVRKGTFIAFVLLIAAEAVSLLLQVAYRFFLEFPLTTVGRTVAAFSMAMRQWSNVTLVLTALAFGFLLEYNLHSKRVRVGICGILAVQAVELALNVPKTTVMYTLERLFNDPIVMRIYTESLTYLSFAVWLLIVVFTCVLIQGLTRDCGVRRVLWLAVIMEVACQAVGLFWVSQNQNVAHALTVGIGGLAVAVLWTRVLSLRAGR